MKGRRKSQRKERWWRSREGYVKRKKKSAGKSKLQDREKEESEKEGKEGRLTGNISGGGGIDEEKKEDR